MPRLPRLARRRGAAPLRISPPSGLLELLREGPAPLSGAAPERAGADSLEVAVVVPSFRRGSGGHSTLANLVRGLEQGGHRCSFWIQDDEGRHAAETAEETASHFRSFFGPFTAAVHRGLGGWRGADVVVATGWQTVPAVLRLPGAAARAYVVQDHEPEFYGTSAEATWAAQTYGMGLHCIAASAWLADLLRERHGASASHFDLGVDHATYRRLDVPRREDRVLFYARAVTARRAVPLGLLALEELARRRPHLDIALFGESRPVQARFAHRDLGVLEGEALARAYAEATVGIVLSMTNPSLVPTEMLACGTPCVDLATGAMVDTFGADGPIELAPFDPIALADAVERLLDDPALRARRARAGLELVATRTWQRASDQVATGLRHALRACA